MTNLVDKILSELTDAYNKSNNDPTELAKIELRKTQIIDNIKKTLAEQTRIAEYAINRIKEIGMKPRLPPPLTTTDTPAPTSPRHTPSGLYLSPPLYKDNKVPKRI